MMHSLIRALLITALLGMLGACGGGGDGEGEDNGGGTGESGALTDTSAVSTAIIAQQEPRITNNLPWTTAQTDFENIQADIRPKGAPYTTWKRDYDERLATCEAYGDQEYPNGETICVPENDTNASCAVTEMLQYGYYCGKGRPGNDGFPSPNEPLDGIDYCCYLHDQNIWHSDGATEAENQRQNSCGMLMCLYNMSEYPAGAAANFPKPTGYRQCIHDWAAYGCTLNQSNDAPPPTVAIQP